jgi:hypothetical protein
VGEGRDVERAHAAYEQWLTDCYGDYADAPSEWHELSVAIERLLAAHRSPEPAAEPSLAAALAHIKYVAEGHHTDQPAHVLLHCLTVDIPHMVDIALGLDPDAAPGPHASHRWTRAQMVESGRDVTETMCWHCEVAIDDEAASDPCPSHPSAKALAVYVVLTAEANNRGLAPTVPDDIRAWAESVVASHDGQPRDVFDMIRHAALRSPARAYVFDPSDPWVERAERFIQSREKVSKRTGREIKDKGAVNIMRGLLAALRSPEPAAEPVATFQVTGDHAHDAGFRILLGGELPIGEYSIYQASRQNSAAEPRYTLDEDRE